MKRRSGHWCLMRTVAVNYASAGTSPNGIELKAERRKPSGEKHCDIEDIPSLTGVLAHFRLH